jgi:hypothetical protein
MTSIQPRFTDENGRDSVEREYYIYAYIDPRNMNPFYIGKGKNLRKYAHLSDDSSSTKSQRIDEIRKDGEEPLIRILAKGCSQGEAFLIEATMIWWLQSQLTNKVAGQGSAKFRPQPEFSLLKKINGFDFANGIYLVNCGDGGTRSWDDFRNYGFICAGGDPKWSNPIKKLNNGDIVVAYLKGDGYIGIGRVVSSAVMAKDFVLGKGVRLSSLTNLASPNLFHDESDERLAEYCVGIDWVKASHRGEGKFRQNSGLYTTPLVVTSLINQPKTIEYLESEFGIEFEGLLQEVSAHELPAVDQT